MEYLKLWPELGALALLVIGFLFAISVVTSKFMSFIMIFLWGLIFGRMWYKLKGHFKFPWALIVLGFLVGFILANIVLEYSGIFTLVILFFGGMWLSYYTHDKKFLKSTEY